MSIRRYYRKHPLWGLVFKQRRSRGLLKLLGFMLLFYIAAGFLLGCSPDVPPDPQPPIIVEAEDRETVDAPKETPPQEEEPEPAEKEAPQSSPPISIQGELLVEFIDVGQGDSILVISPEGKTLLIDAGDRGKFGIIDRHLKSRGVTRIDILVATHPHADHIGSMAEVIGGYDIGRIYMPDATHTTQTFENLLLAIERKGLEIDVGKAGMTIPFGDGVRLEVLAPVGSPGDLNDSSIVLHLTFGETTFFFAGDMESHMEARITGAMQADVLKVGHHGSNTSSSAAFLQKVQPSIAIISVGEGNRYSHPHPDALSRLFSSGADIYRTDESGTIVVKSDGRTLSVSGTPTATSGTVESPEEDEEGPTVGERTVFITATGARYHMETCSSLSASKKEVLISEAKSQGLTACGRCNPGN